jgi:hypothetical protein
MLFKKHPSAFSERCLFEKFANEKERKKERRRKTGNFNLFPSLVAK